MRIDLRGDDAERVRFLSCIPVDFAPQLVRLFAVHAPRLASPFGSDRAQALKQEHTPRIAGADVGDHAGDSVGCVLIHVSDMTPELLVAALALDRPARLPLFFGDALEVVIALLIKPLVAHKATFDDTMALPDGNHSEPFDVEIHRHRDQVGVLPALDDLLGADLSCLGEVQFR